MELKIFWTNFATIELKNIYNYYKKVASISIAKKIVKEITNSTLILSQNIEIGQVEELLNDKPQNFRYLVYKNYKIIYWINQKENQIEILDVFDCRQNPIKIVRNK
jgi:toxin ParE1/3/4